GATIVNTYDNLGQLIRVDESGLPGQPMLSTEYSYDNLGRLSRHTYPSGLTIQNNYNSYGFLESIEIPSNVPGPLSPQLIWKVNTKNHLGQVKTAKYYDQMNNPLYNISRTYDLAGAPETRRISVNSGFLQWPVLDFEYDF